MIALTAIIRRHTMKGDCSDGNKGSWSAYTWHIKKEDDNGNTVD
jgi:hypothetical protein